MNGVSSTGKYFARCIFRAGVCDRIPQEESPILRRAAGFSAYWLSRMCACARPKINVVDEVLARGLIKRGQTVYLDNGSTFVFLAARILDRADRFAPLRVVTGNSVVQLLWMMHPDARQLTLDCIGGEYVPDHFCSNGRVAPHLSRASLGPDIDMAFLGVCRLDPGSGFYARISDVVDVKRMALDRARAVTVLLDETKIEPAGGHDELVARLSFQDGKAVIVPAKGHGVGKPVSVYVGMCTEAVENEAERRQALNVLLPEGLTLTRSERNERVFALARKG